MQNELLKNIECYLSEHRKKKQICMVLSVLSVLMAFSVYGALCMPAISMTKDEPKLETKTVRAVYGDELSFRVKAQAAVDDDPTVFVLHTESNGAGLSDLYEFEETGDGEAVCLIDTEDGEPLELHREFKGKGNVDYWFSLEPEETAAFQLYCNSDMYTNLEEEEALEKDAAQEPPEAQEAPPGANGGGGAGAGGAGTGGAEETEAPEESEAADPADKETAEDPQETEKESGADESGTADETENSGDQQEEGGSGNGNQGESSDSKDDTAEGGQSGSDGTGSGSSDTDTDTGSGAGNSGSSGQDTDSGSADSGKDDSGSAGGGSSDSGSSDSGSTGGGSSDSGSTGGGSSDNGSTGGGSSDSGSTGGGSSDSGSADGGSSDSGSSDSGSSDSGSSDSGSAGGGSSDSGSADSGSSDSGSSDSGSTDSGSSDSGSGSGDSAGDSSGDIAGLFDGFSVHLFQQAYALDGEIAAQWEAEKATPSDADEDEDADGATPSEADEEKTENGKQYFRIYGGAGKNYKAGLRAAKKQDNSAELVWSEKLEELTLTAVSESGITVTMTGSEELFPLGDLRLVVTEVKDLEAYKASKASEAEANEASPSEADEATPSEADEATPSEADDTWIQFEDAEDVEYAEDGEEAEDAESAEEEEAARIALAEAEARAASKWLFDIKIMNGDQEVEPFGPVEVTFGGITQNTDNTDENPVSVFHIDDKSDKVDDMEAWTDEEGNIIMQTDHFSVYEVVETAAAATPMEYDELLEGLGMANQFGVFARYMYGGGGHSACNIAVQELDLTQSNGLAIGNDGSVLSSVGNQFKIKVTKNYTGTGAAPATCSFGLWESGTESEQTKLIESLTLNVTDGRCSGVFEGLDVKKAYVVYELDKSGRPILTPTEILKWDGGPYRGTGNENYIENFTGGSNNVSVDTNSGSDFTLHVGSDYTVERNNVVLSVKKNGNTQVKFNNFQSSAQADSNCDVAWDEEFSRLISFSKDLNGKQSNYSLSDRTSGVKVLNVQIKRNETVKTALARTLGYSDSNMLQNSGIPLAQNQYLVINITWASNVSTKSAAIPSIRIDGKDGQQAIAQQVIWNFSGFTGTVTQESSQTMGTILVPEGAFKMGGQNHNGGVIAEKFYRNGGELHKLTFEQVYAPEVFFTEGTASGTGDVEVNVTKTWSDGNDSHSGDSITAKLLANGKEVDTLELNSGNNWTGKWERLPTADEEGKPITYSVTEEAVDGYYSSVTGEQIEVPDGEWVTADRFSDGGSYLIVNSGKGLADSSTGLASENVNEYITDKTSAPSAAMWRADSSGQRFTLTNIESGRKLGLYYNYSYGQWAINTGSGTLFSETFYCGNAGGYSNRLYTTNSQYGTAYLSGMPNGYGATVNSGAYYGLPFTLYEWKTTGSTGSTSWSFTITNTKDSDKPNEQHPLDIQKTIDALRPDTGRDNPDTGLDNSGADMTDYYRLYLDLQAETIGAPADVVLVLDNSSSMIKEFGNSTRANVLVDTAEKFTEQLLLSDSRNRVSVVGYNGEWDQGKFNENGYNNNLRGYTTGKNDAWTSGWKTSYESLRTEDLETLRMEDGNNMTGTNIMQALKVGGDLLTLSERNRPEAHRYMIFISDGYPTFYYLTLKTEGVSKLWNSRYDYEYAPPGAPESTLTVQFDSGAYKCESTFAEGYLGRFGTGGSPSGKYGKKPTIDYAKKFHGNHDDTTIYSIGVGKDTDGEGDYQTASPLMVDTLKAIATNENNYFPATEAEALEEAFRKILYGPPVTDVSITDELSKYVEWYGEQPDVLVTMTDKAGKVTKLWGGSGPGTGGTVGGALPGNVTDEGISIIQDVTFTPLSDPDSTSSTTGTVKAAFNSGYTLVPENTYTLSFNVKATQTAYSEYAENRKNGNNGYGSVKGDLETDYGTNDTSSDKPGFHSNLKAEAGYTTEGLHYEQEYLHPVIQVIACSLELLKTDIIDEAKILPGAGFDLYKDVPEGQGGVLIPGLDEEKYGIKINQEMLLTDEKGEIEVPSLVPAAYYLIETRAPTGYQLLTRPICFTLSQNGVDITGTGPDTKMVEVKTGEDQQPVLVIKNTRGFEMPHTGGMGTALYTAIGLMFMTAATFCYVKKRSSERRRR